jgi:predicted DsbA family dithiol-disulfide isomerase
MIEVFADIVCPFTHVGLQRLVAHRREIGDNTVIRVRAWPLELVNGKPLAAAFVAEEVAELRAQVAPDLFVGFAETQFPATSLPALDLAAAAYRRSTPAGEQVSLALRHALFEEGRDISSPAVLADIARSHDLRPTGQRDRAAVVDDWEQGRERGVLGSPHFFVDGDDFFCPSLEITRVENHVQIRRDDAGFERFLAHAFPATAVGI